MSGPTDGDRGTGGQAHDGYGGHVRAGGPPAARTVTPPDGTEIEIAKMSVGGMDNNVYLLHAPSTGDGVLVDAADEPERILDLVGGRRITAIVTTHRHADHWRALGEIAGTTGATTMAGADDAGAIGVRIDRPLSHGDAVTAGPIRLDVLHTPGHTEGSICLLLRTRGTPSAHLFTGDTLFPGGPGNTFGDAAAFATIMTSLRERVFALPDDTWVYPGHGDDTTLGAERGDLDTWQERGW